MIGLSSAEIAGSDFVEHFGLVSVDSAVYRNTGLWFADLLVLKASFTKSGPCDAIHLELPARVLSHEILRVPFAQFLVTLLTSCGEEQDDLLNNPWFEAFSAQSLDLEKTSLTLKLDGIHANLQLNAKKKGFWAFLG